MRINDNFPYKNIDLNRIYEIGEECKKYLFIGYFENTSLSDEEYKKIKANHIMELGQDIVGLDIMKQFVAGLDHIEAQLKADLDFFYESDPAAKSKEEIVYTYPGFIAITYYRIAHYLRTLGVSFIPRVISEKAHSLYGIDINPGAEIDAPFFIDHGTGIVIGETSKIGKYCKLYHGVTLGALSLSEGRKLSCKKRHPTLEDYVTIYSSASILGGETIIGEHVTIGANVFIVNSVLKNSKVVYNTNQIKVSPK